MIWGYSPVSFLLNEDFPDNEFFEFNGDGELFPVGILDFEERQSYKLFIEVHDGKGGIWTGEISVMVSNDETEDVDEDGLIEKLENSNGLSGFNPDFDNDGFDDLTELNAGTNPKDPSSVPLRANQPPTKLFLSSVEISENSPLSTRVGILSVVDSDENEIHQFKLTGKFPDNAHFKISDNELLTSSVFDFENKDLYLIHITVVDSAEEGNQCLFRFWSMIYLSINLLKTFYFYQVKLLKIKLPVQWLGRFA